MSYIHNFLCYELLLIRGPRILKSINSVVNDSQAECSPRQLGTRDGR
jgi:hypothetical protein